MKNAFILLFVAVLIGSMPTDAHAQSSLPKRDSTLLDERQEGDYQVRRYLVSEEEDADYSVRYQINNATLNRSLNGNAAELTDLKNLITGFLNDTLNEVKQIKIIGYASPDGPMQLNEGLARRRAEAMQHYVDQHDHLSKSYAVQLDSEVAAWASLRDRVAASEVPMRDSVLLILDSRHTEAEKQAALKKWPSVWHYLATHILPPVRRAELAIDYHVGTVVEQRVKIAPKPAEPTPAPAPTEVVVIEEVEEVVDPCCQELCASDQLGVIVDMTDVEVDF